MVQNPKSDIWDYFNNNVKEGVAVCKICNQSLNNKRAYSLRYHVQSLHNPNSEVWKHYDGSRKLEGIAICKVCLKNVKTDRFFNLFLHLKTHDIFMEEIGNQRTNTLRVADGSSSGPTEQIKQGDDCLFVCIQKRTLVDAIVGLMIDEGVTPQLFASKNMQALLKPFCDAISNEHDIKFSINEIQSERVVHSIASYIRKKFSNELQSRLLSLRLDMDFNQDLRTFHVIAQFIKDTQLEKYTLGEIHLEGDQQFTEESIVKILDKFNIDCQQIVSVYWDDSRINFKKLVTNAMYLDEMQKFEKRSYTKLGDVNVERYVGVIAHLCIFDVLKSPSIFPLFMESRNLAKFINETPNLFGTTLKQSDVKIPQLDSPWKWGSTYTMMNDLMQCVMHLENFKFEQPECPEDRFNYSEHLREFIKAFCKSCGCVQKYAERFYSSEMIFGDFYAQWLKCRLLTENLFKSSKNGTILATISGELLRSMEIRTNDLLNQNRFMACLYLDPRFQHTLTETRKASALLYLNKLWSRFKLYNFEFLNRFPETTGDKHQQPQEFEDEEDACLNEFLSQSVQQPSIRTGISEGLHDLKLQFQTVDVNVVSFWKELKFSEPELHRMATICFAIPTTQNCGENNFSLECKKKRTPSYTSNTCPTFKENIELIRLNQHLLKKVMEKLEPFTEKNASDVGLVDSQSVAQHISTVSSSPPSTSSIPSSSKI